MSDSAVIKQHDRRPYLRSALLDGAGAAFAIGGSDSLAVLFRPVNQPTLVLSATGYLVTVDEYVTNPAGASIHVTQAIEHRWLTTGAPWASGEHTGLVGIFDWENQVTNAAGEARTFPLVGYNVLTVYDDVNYP